MKCKCGTETGSLIDRCHDCNNRYMTQYRRTHRARINAYSRQKNKEYRRNKKLYIEILGRLVETTQKDYTVWYGRKFRITGRAA